MAVEEKRKIQAWIPVSIWIKIDQMGFTSQTEAVMQAFKKLLEEPDTDQTRSNIDQTGSNEINESSAVIEEKEKRLLELQDHNETLKKELEDLKAMHNNYMLQMQTLINQKAIEAPGAKKPWWRFW